MKKQTAKRSKRSAVVDAAVFGARVRALMEQKGLSPSELADRADLARSAMTMFFSGERKPSADAVAKLAEVLDATTDFLLGRSDESNVDDLLRHEKVRELMHLFLSLSSRDQDRLLEMVRLIAQTAPAEDSV